MELTIWDVQHGSAAYLKTPTGKHVVIDLGIGDISQQSDSLSPLSILRARGITQLDQVIITHPHKDHLDDIFSYDAMNPRALQRPLHLTDNDVRAGNQGRDQQFIEKYLEINRRYNAPIAPGMDPTDQNNSGMVIGCFAPVTCSRANLNNHSIVTFMQYAHSVVCLPGDNEAASWRELLLNPDVQHWLRLTDVFVASHHGREAGYCDEVFDYCKPKLVVISDTSAVAKYQAKAKGWEVHSRSKGTSETRYVITTRCDGTVNISTGFSNDGRYLAVWIE